MKSLCKITFALLLSLTIAKGYSQNANSKPEAFKAFPNSIKLSPTDLNDAFAVTEGQHIVLSFANNFKFAGTVISNVTKYGNLQSMTIQSDELDKSIFNLSRQMLDNKNITYVGRIMSNNASDGYQIKKDGEGNYSFEKIEAKRLKEDCHL